MLDVGVHVVRFVLEEGGVRVGCDSRCGVECWDDVVLCKSEAESGVEEEVGRGGVRCCLETVDLVVDSGAVCVEDFCSFRHAPWIRRACSVGKLRRGAVAEYAGGYLRRHLGISEGVIEFLV